jgi:hypothetical protein
MTPPLKKLGFDFAIKDFRFSLVARDNFSSLKGEIATAFLTKSLAMTKRQEKDEIATASLSGSLAITGFISPPTPRD